MKLLPIIIGVILILAALGTYGYSMATIQFVPAGTPAIDIPAWSTSSSTPTQISASTAGWTFGLLANNIDPNSVTSVTATIKSNGVQVASGAMTFYGAFNSSANWYQYTVPVAIISGTTYEIDNSLVSSTQGQFSCIHYIEGIMLQGYFTINGAQVTTTTVMKVTNPTLTFTYVVTASGIASPTLVVPTISIYQGTTLLQTLQRTGESNWIYTFPTYTLPAYGTYTVTGTATYGGTPITFMSVVAGYNTGDAFGVSEVLEITLALAGSAFIVIGFILPAGKEVSR